MGGATPYKDRALAHYDKGWSVFPAAPGGKEPLVKGRSGGYQSEPVDRSTVERELDRYDKANIGIRLPDDMIGLDLDLRVNEETGEVTADGLDAFFGLELPPTIGLGHTVDGEDEAPEYRHHLYRVPEFVSSEDIARLKDSKGGIDLLRWMHRLTVGSGSLHKSGETYRWVRKDGTISNGIPLPDQVTQLTTEEWQRVVEFFGERSSSSGGGTLADVDTEEWLNAHGGEPTDRMKAAVAVWTQRAPDDQRHSAAGTAAYRVAQEAEDGETGAQRAFMWLRARFVEAIADRSSEIDAEAEFDRIMVSAISKAVGQTETEGRGGVVLEDDGEPLRIVHPPKDPDAEDDTPSARRSRKADAYNESLNAEPVEFAREYLQRHHPEDVLKYVNEQFWAYDAAAGHWLVVKDRKVKKAIQSDLQGSWHIGEDSEIQPIRLKGKNVNELLDVLKNETFDEPETPTGGVPFTNGWLDVRTGELLDPAPERFNTWTVPLEYGHGGPIGAWLAFLESIGWGVGTDEQRVLRQWFGYLLSGENHRQKMLLLHGPTRSGKGTILKVAYHLMGRGATGLRLQSLGGEFGLQPLLGKSLAVVGDARFTAKIDKGVVEALLSVSGTDPQSVNIKNKEQVSTQLPTRLMVATNDRPVFTESSNALALRFLILHMSPSFLGREDLELEAKLLAELPGIVEWALEGYRDLNELGHFSTTVVGTEMSQDFVRDSAPIRYFVEEMCVIREGVKVTNDDLYTAYGLWCDRNRMMALNRVHFMRELLTAYEGQIADAASNGTRIKRGITLTGGTVTP